jgi:BirA family transcriptional regulator, biotin operon repressor / biotin---[acetyl-CoA-carboxylase] ligase
MIALDPRAAAAGVRLVTHEVLGSTNTEALNRARRGERGPLWIVAGRQTAGRGRRGRAWISQPGNLFASLLLTVPASPACRPQLSLVAALAVHDAVAEIAAGLASRVVIKWPNDLLLDRAKFAGILLEGEGSGLGAVAIGMGINCACHPADTDYPATDLAAAGIPASPAMLMGPLSFKMIGRLAQWNGGAGFAAVRADWIARAAGIGEDIRLRIADRELSGRFETLDAAGGLVLRSPDGRTETITAADVFMAG